LEKSLAAIPVTTSDIVIEKENELVVFVGVVWVVVKVETAGPFG
jgi:hypothetical protein